MKLNHMVAQQLIIVMTIISMIIRLAILIKNKLSLVPMLMNTVQTISLFTIHVLDDLMMKMMISGISWMNQKDTTDLIHARALNKFKLVSKNGLIDTLEDVVDKPIKNIKQIGLKNFIISSSPGWDVKTLVNYGTQRTNFFG